MRSLDRNRVFDTTEMEQLRKDTYTVFEQAITVSEQYNEDRDRVVELFDRVPAEAKISGFPLSLPTDFVYPEYADQQKKCNDIFENILCQIPKFDKEAADANEELINEIKETTRTVQELRELLKTGDVRLSVSAFEKKLKQICGPDFSEEEKAKMKLEERKQSEIEELCVLLSYEKDLTGSEKKRRDTLINSLFEEGDIPKMRAVEEKLSKKGNSKWTQSERSFMEQVLRYATEEEKTELDTIGGTGKDGLTFTDKYGRSYAYNPDAWYREWGESNKVDLGNGHIQSNVSVKVDVTMSENPDGFAEIKLIKHFYSKLNLTVYESTNGGFHINPVKALMGESQSFVRDSDEIYSTVAELGDLNYKNRYRSEWKWTQVGVSAAMDISTIVTFGTAAAGTTSVKAGLLAGSKTLITREAIVQSAGVNGLMMAGDKVFYNENPSSPSVLNFVPIVATIYALDNAMNNDDAIYGTFVDSDYVNVFVVSLK